MRRHSSLTWALALLLSPPAMPAVAEVSAAPAGSTGLEPAVLARFETSLEELRRQLKIPGLSAAIVSEGRLTWARGFGHADVQRGIPR